MNILLLTTHLDAGGITSYLFNLAKGLRAGEHPVTLVSSGGNRSEDFARIGVRLVTLPIRTKSELDLRIYRSLPGLRRLLRDHPVDVIHTQTRITQVMGDLLCRMSGRPLVTTCHGFFKPRWSRRLFPCWGQETIAISPAVREHLERDFHVPADHITVIRSGIDIEDFPLLSDEQKMTRRRSLHVPGGPVIGIIARLSEEKGHGILIRAMAAVIARNPDARLIIVGEGRTEADLRRQVEARGLTGHVLFFKTSNRTSEFLSVMDVFVLPSTKEGLGLSVMEAQAAGLPVIATRVGGLPSLVRHGETGILVDPGDPDGLSAAVLDLLSRPEAARDMGRRARDFIARECSYRKMAGETLRVYGGALARP